MMRAAKKGKSAMTTSTANLSAVARDQSRLIIPQLASFYEYTPGLSWLIVRLTAGGMLLVHGVMKAMPMVDVGLAATLEGLRRQHPGPTRHRARFAARLCGVLPRDDRRGLRHARAV